MSFRLNAARNDSLASQVAADQLHMRFKKFCVRELALWIRFICEAAWRLNNTVPCSRGSASSRSSSSFSSNLLFSKAWKSCHDWFEFTLRGNPGRLTSWAFNKPQVMWNDCLRWCDEDKLCQVYWTFHMHTYACWANICNNCVFWKGMCAAYYVYRSLQYFHLVSSLLCYKSVDSRCLVKVWRQREPSEPSTSNASRTVTWCHDAYCMYAAHWCAALNFVWWQFTSVSAPGRGVLSGFASPCNWHM